MGWYRKGASRSVWLGIGAAAGWAAANLSDPFFFPFLQSCWRHVDTA